ncbi:hypothetical protein [Anatilimnocola floriformis]|uniref:hypothetical protein n=1 Tax=Anatilimnocola floriformis TaxID=2948575 RepID=UPI0020C5746B|nr:hypothetical protein [Anatilimnocola floriformis]
MRHQLNHTVVELSRRGNVLSIDAARQLVEACLETDRLLYDPVEQRVVSQTESLIPNTGLRANAGLEMMIRYIGLQRGFEINFENHGCCRASLPVLSANSSSSCAVTDPAVLQFVYQNELGLVRAGAPVDLVRLAAEILLAYSQKSFVIVVATRAERREWRRRLRSFGVSLQEHALDCFGESVKRVVVTTPIGAAEDDVFFHSRHLAILPDAIASLGERFQTMLLCADPKARLLGFLRADTKPSPREQDLLRAQFGFAELTIPAHGQVLVDRRIARLPFVVQPLPDRLKGHELQCSGVWQHPVRNRWIAKLAKVLFYQDWCALANWQPELAEQLHDESRRGVIVLAECVPQAIAIAKRLKRVPIVLDHGLDLGFLSPSDRAKVELRHIGWDCDCIVIATPGGLDRVSLQHIPTIIWAGSGPHVPPLPAEYLMMPYNSQRRLTIVDVDDQHHPVLRLRSQLRRAAYANAGWIAPGVDSECARIRQFLARRPIGGCR